MYLRSLYDNGDVAIDLVTSKGRVAPLQTLTIPRLELKGAVVLSHLLKQVALDLHVHPSNLYVWTDSMIVLGWLLHSPSKLAVFVGNRVAKITALVPEAKWRHVPGKDNPADCLSRGLRPTDMCKFSLWWNGPE